MSTKEHAVSNFSFIPDNVEPVSQVESKKVGVFKGVELFQMQQLETLDRTARLLLELYTELFGELPVRTEQCSNNTKNAPTESVYIIQRIEDKMAQIKFMQDKIERITEKLHNKLL